jgi:CheY-like chemotaxis protein
MPPDLHVLVAEDHPVNRLLIDKLLQGLGVQATLVPDGGAAVAAVRDGAYDLVLMDVHMPGMDGLEATHAIRLLSDDAAAVPIVALTASALVQDRQRCLEAGMDDHLSKPIDKEALAKALAYWGRKGRSSAA